MLKTIEHGPILEIRLQRPPANALDPALVSALTEALQAAGEDAGAVVLSGREGMFSAGLDVPALLDLDRPAMDGFWAAFAGLLRTIACMPVPTVAAITGHSPAGGAVMALFADYRVMSRGPFKIGLNETRVGLTLPAFIHGALVRLVGAHRAERLVVPGALVSPEQALHFQLVDELAEDPKATVAMARRWCEHLLELPAHTMKANRRIMRESLTGLFDDLDLTDNGDFLDAWFSDATQASLRALAASLRK